MGFPAGWTDLGEPRRNHEFSFNLDARLCGWWTAEPDIPRVGKKIPKRVQRLKALGNAVVPAQVYPIFAAIAEIEANP
jgi:hypothetical protein